MNIQTKFHGDKWIDEQAIIQFEQGVPGFIDETAFTVLELGEGTPLYILQSIKTADVAFIIVNPFDYFPAYEFELSAAVKEQLDIKAETDVAAFVILTVKEPFEQTTANLQAPVIINVKQRHGKQVVLTEKQWTTRQPLFAKAKEASPCSS